jgi:hypothetical protein
MGVLCRYPIFEPCPHEIIQYIVHVPNNRFHQSNQYVSRVLRFSFREIAGSR